MIYAKVLNSDDEVVETLALGDETSFDALERLVDGFDYTVERTEG